MTGSVLYEHCWGCSGQLQPLPSDDALAAVLGPDASSVQVCARCNGVCGPISIIRSFLRRGMVELSEADGRERYFDGRSSTERVHGWFDTVTRYVVQYG